jgi:Fe2+ or Zn2+ uptake regulation protein
MGSDVPLSSLYRTLTVLEEANIIAPHFGARGLTRYELAEWITGHHHHYVCIECGAVEDIDVSEEIEHKVDALVEEISGMASFNPTSHVLEIEGRCRRCR